MPVNVAPIAFTEREECCAFFCVFFRAISPTWRPERVAAQVRSDKFFFVKTHSLADISPIFSWFSLGVLKILKHSKHSFETFNKPLTFFYLADQVFLGIA